MHQLAFQLIYEVRDLRYEMLNLILQQSVTEADFLSSDAPLR